MGGPLPRSETPHRFQIATPVDRADAETRIVSLAYLVWPVAIYDRIAPRADASNWYRFHMRQALWFGNLAAAASLAAFLWPLLASFFVTGIGATIWMYVVAMVLDAALFVLWLILAIRYSQRAARGELFDIPWVARLTGKRSQNQ